MLKNSKKDASVKILRSDVKKRSDKIDEKLTSIKEEIDEIKDSLKKKERKKVGVSKELDKYVLERIQSYINNDTQQKDEKTDRAIIELYRNYKDVKTKRAPLFDRTHF